MAHAAARRVARRPALAGAGIGRVPVGAERAAVDPGVGDGIHHLLERAAEHCAGDRGRRDANEDHVVEADAVVRVLERRDALDLVRLDHRGQQVAHRRRRAALGRRLARLPVGDREDAAEVVGGMAPFRREPGVVEIQPADHCADVEGGLDRIELVTRAGHACTTRHRGARHDGPEHARAGGEGERLEPAGERVHQAVARRLVGDVARDAGVARIGGDVDEDAIRCGPLGRADVVLAHGWITSGRPAEPCAVPVRCSWRLGG